MIPRFDNQTVANQRAVMRMQRACWGSIARSFRGSLVENCKRFKFVGDGYKSMPAEQNGYFMIESARHLAGPLRALLDGYVRFVHIIGATQVMKSLCGDIWAVYLLEHLCASMLVLFEDDPKADLYCQKRAIETVKQHPVLSRMIKQSQEVDRFGTTGTRIKTPYSSLLVKGLNDGNVSSLSWQYIWVSEAWQKGSNGMLKKAFKRADRFPNTCKILNESQASVVNTDLHRAVKDVLQVPLEWRCPACAGVQTWELKHWSFKRPDDFVPLRQKKVGTAIIGGETVIIEPPMPKPGTYAGMIIPPNTSGQLDIVTRARQSYWECIHCGHHIHDTKQEREAIAETYTQDYRQNIGGLLIPPREVCFVLPFEANKDNRFESTVTGFLQAMHAKTQGNEVPLQDWFCAERSIFYDKGQTMSTELAPTIGSYDPKTLIADEHSRNMSIDVQKKIDAAADEDVPGSFWVMAEVVDKLGNSWDLQRAFCTSWEEVVAIQRRWKIPNGRVVIDGRKWTAEILQKAAEYSELVPVTDPLLKKLNPRLTHYRQCWKVLLGDDANYFKWSKPNGRTLLKPYSMPHAHEKFVVNNGHSQSVKVFTTQWSNLAISDQLHTIMLGGEGVPKIHTLDRAHLDDKTRAREVGDLTYERQINAEYRTERRGKPFWEKKRPDNHYLDCRKMLLVRKLMDGLMGGGAMPMLGTTLGDRSSGGTTEAGDVNLPGIKREV